MNRRCDKPSIAILFDENHSALRPYIPGNSMASHLPSSLRKITAKDLPATAPRCMYAPVKIY
jgi:hypothetical protein